MNTFTSPEKQGFRDFDLPKEHLLDERHYVPPKTHDPAELARRRDLTPGTLVAESQQKGLLVARRIIEQVSEEEGILFASNMLCIAGLNTSWYSYAQNSAVMRRRLKLPILAHPRLRAPETILEDSAEALGKQVDRAGQLVTATEYSLRSEGQLQTKLGVGIGNASLRLAMLEPVMSETFYAVNDNETLAQDIVRRRCLQMLERARTMHREIGSHPSIAQLSDPYSHLAVYWHRNAPGSAQSAVVDALVN